MPYKKIAETAVASNASTVTVSGVPNTYKSYEIWFAGNTTGSSAVLNFYVNGSRSQIYRAVRQFFTGSGSPNNVGSINTSQTEVPLYTMGGVVDVIIRIIVTKLDGGTVFHYYFGEGNVGGQAGMGSAIWEGGDAITSFSVQTSNLTGLKNGGKLIVYGLE